MIIKSVELKNYRNYQELKLDLSPGTNIFYGDNAQGKTNILESVYMGCTTKSHRGTKDRDVIKFEEDESHIKFQLERDDSLHRIDMHLKKNKTKGIAIDGIPIRKASELFGIANVVFFSPEDLSIIKSGPSERRKFIDMELCQLDKIYVHNLISYNKIVVQRNKLLKDSYMVQQNPELLDVLDQQMCQYGAHIIRTREVFIEELNQIIVGIHRKISGGKETLSIRYEPNTKALALETELRAGRGRDIRMKASYTGPHRDDISFYVNDINIRKFGSQGQQRTAALSLKLSEIDLVKKRVKDAPVLLLDDVLSELDNNRQNQLLSGIEDIQTLITCTGLEDFVSNRFHIDKIFKVVSGAVITEN